MLLFQHNNVKSVEWMGVRRELNAALRKVDAELGIADPAGESATIQIVQTGIFASALKVVEYFHVDSNTNAASTHGLSKKAWESARKNAKIQHGLEPLLSGPLMLVTFPSVSPRHMQAVLSTLAPSEKFPAPKRKANPAYHELSVQSGLQKLLLLGARVEGKAFDMEGTRWVAGIEGGIDGLRGQLVAMLSSIGAGITNTLESAGRSLYFTVEGRREMLEEEEKGPQASETEKSESS